MSHMAVRISNQSKLYHATIDDIAAGSLIHGTRPTTKLIPASQIGKEQSDHPEPFIGCSCMYYASIGAGFDKPRLQLR